MGKYRILPVIFLCFLLLFVSCSQNKTEYIKEPSSGQDLGVKQIDPGINKPITNTTPAPTKPKVMKIVGSKRISIFTTRLIDKSKNRIDNIRRASLKINNYIVMPGKTFSFNKTVGERLHEKGYKKAIILVDGERADDIGGGICQLSTTLYNAALKLGLKITERHTHSGDVHYVPIGQDAAIDYGSKDLKFINNKDYPIKITIKIKRKTITVSIFKLILQPS